jgi:DNA-binding phage protein
MDKTKTSAKPKAFSSRKRKSKGKQMGKKTPKASYVLREDANVKEYDPIKNLLDTKKMGAAIMECFLKNDTEGVLEVLESYIYAVNRTQFLKEAKVPRSTAYNVFKRRNPTIKTLAKIMHATTHP